MMIVVFIFNLLHHRIEQESNSNIKIAVLYMTSIRFHNPHYLVGLQFFVEPAMQHLTAHNSTWYNAETKEAAPHLQTTGAVKHPTLVAVIIEAAATTQLESASRQHDVHQTAAAIILVELRCHTININIHYCKLLRPDQILRYNYLLNSRIWNIIHLLLFFLSTNQPWHFVSCTLTILVNCRLLVLHNFRVQRKIIYILLTKDCMRYFRHNQLVVVQFWVLKRYKRTRVLIWIIYNIGHIGWKI